MEAYRHNLDGSKQEITFEELLESIDAAKEGKLSIQINLQDAPVVHAQELSETQKLMGKISLFLTIIAISAIVGIHSNISEVFSELGNFLLGGVNEVVADSSSIFTIAPALLTIVLIALFFSISIAVITAKIMGLPKKNGVLKELNKMTYGYNYFVLFMTIVVEELVARWLFLGLIPKIAIFSGTVAFYFLVLIGNSIWSFAHVYNFKNKEKAEKWTIVRVLPMFVSGFMFSFVFVKYGLLATILTHSAFNMVLLSSHKRQVPGIGNLSITAYSIFVALVSYVLIDKPLTDIYPWFAANPVFELSGWQFWDYVKVSVFISAVLSALFGIFIYDDEQAPENQKNKKISLSQYVFIYIVFVPVFLAAAYVMYYLMGFIIPDMLTRNIVFGILFSFLVKGSSGSSLARTFWVTWPSTYVTICLVQALGFWSALIMVFFQIILCIPIYKMK